VEKPAIGSSEVRDFRFVLKGRGVGCAGINTMFSLSFFEADGATPVDLSEAPEPSSHALLCIGDFGLSLGAQADAEAVEAGSYVSLRVYGNISGVLRAGHSDSLIQTLMRPDRPLEKGVPTSC